jgi:hypothetical protein
MEDNPYVDVDVMMPNDRAYYFYGLGVEYRPRVYPDLRLHAYVANSTMTNFPGTDGDYNWENMQLTANVGVTWRLDFMKFLPEKLK